MSETEVKPSERHTRALIVEQTDAAGKIEGSGWVREREREREIWGRNN